MKEDVADRLRLAVLERAALTAQRAVRGFVARKQYKALKEEEARRQREIEEERKRKQQEEARKKAEEEAKRRAEEAKKRVKAAPVVPVVVETVVSQNVTCYDLLCSACQTVTVIWLRDMFSKTVSAGRASKSIHLLMQCDEDT